MKTLAAFFLALAMTAAGAMTLRAQDPTERDRGPSVYKSGETVTGDITRIDPATKTIEVTPSIPGATGTLEFQAKDSTELAKFHVGQTVSGKVSKDTPPKLTNLKASTGMKAPAPTGGMGAGAPMGGDTARAPGAPPPQ